MAGGTGQWWYGLPEAHHYPSRSYHYVQGAKSLSGTLSIEQPDGSILREAVDARRSRMLMVREYDASPEDLFAGLALAQSTQMHPRYATYYEGGMPWELVFLDLDNGAQLMIALLAFHETQRGTATPFTGSDQPTYQLLATLRMPNGKSVKLDDKLRVEHLSYRTFAGRVPTFWVAVKGIWTQAWDYRVSFPGGTVDGVSVPPFDLGVTPPFPKSLPAVDERGNGPTQRIPFDVRGSWKGCPLEGFGWSELIVQWRGREDKDPWWTGGDVPPVPKRCGPPPKPRPAMTRPYEPEPAPEAPPNTTTEGCTAFGPAQPSCEYVASSVAGVGGTGGAPGGWKVEIFSPGKPVPRVLTAFSGYEMYACGTVRPGDRVVATAEPGSGVFVGNPGFCF
jgi:hypothetical protein